MRQVAGKHLISAYAISLEAWRRGLRVTVRHPQWAVYDISDGNSTVTFNYSRPTSLTSPEAHRIVEDKWRTVEALRSSGVPSPASRMFPAKDSSLIGVLEEATRIGYPVVLKPTRGSVGRGVFPNLQDAQEVQNAMQKLLHVTKSRRLLVEEHFSGDDYRIYVVGGHAVAATRRIPAHVVGDGQSTISDLISAKNRNRRANPGLSTSTIKRSADIASHLASQGLSYEYIPLEGETVYLRYKANASAGGDVVDALDALPGNVKEAAVEAVRAIPGLSAAGVDILYNPNLSDDEDYFRVIELNSRAHFGGIMYPTVGTGRDVPKAVIDAYFPESQRHPWADSLKQVGINAKDIISSLLTGTVGEVTISPLENHGYRARREWKIPLPEGGLTWLQIQELKKLALASKVFGFADRRGSSLRVVAAGRGSRVKSFKSHLATLLDTQIPKGSHYGKPIYTGFDIYQ